MEVSYVEGLNIVYVVKSQVDCKGSVRNNVMIRIIKYKSPWDLNQVAILKELG